MIRAYYLTSKFAQLMTAARKVVILVLALVLSACASIQKSSQEERLDDSGIDADSSVKILTPSASTMISPELLKEDFTFLKERLLEIHPEPFARYPNHLFEQEFQKVLAQLRRPMTRGEFYSHAMPLLAKLKDVHTYIHLPKDHNGNYRRVDERLFPLAVILEQGKLYVAADLSSKPQIETGAILHSINDSPVTELIEKMRKLTTQETDTGQNRRVQMDFARLLAVIGKGENTYRIDYSINGLEKSAVVDGISTPEGPKEGSRPVSYYGYSKLTEKTSLLWLNDFNESPEVFVEYLDRKFSEMEGLKVENLIIDMRYNSGGLSENLKALLSKVTEEPILWAEKGQIRVSTYLQRHHRAATRHRREDKLSWGFKWLPVEWTNQLQRSIWWADPGELIDLQLEPVAPSKNKRLKRVWVLTNGFCYSACSFFVASVNHYELARTIGEVPGSLASFQFAYPIVLTLPHSQLKLNLPSMRLDFSESDEASLIEPHLTVIRTGEDIRNRRDVILNTAIQEAESQPEN